MLMTPERRTGPELLDLPPTHYSLEELKGCFYDLTLVNQYLGDNRAILKHLGRMTAGNTREGSTILDIGTGSADIPIAIAKWARENGIHFEITAIDNNPMALDIARSRARGYPGVNIFKEDALEMPFPDKSFDFVLCSKTLHHLNSEEAVRLIKEAARVSRRGYMIMDLRRGWIPYILICLLTRLFTANRLTRNDGPLSVLRSFTPQELALLATSAGEKRFQVCREPFWLMLLMGEAG